MLLPNSAHHQPFLEQPFERRLFTRRADLTSEIRLIIAMNGLYAMMNSVWGTITHLAAKYGISRPFVYSLAYTLKHVGQSLFGETAQFVATSLREQAIEMMLLLRLEACSSIGATSSIMNRLDCELSRFTLLLA